MKETFISETNMKIIFFTMISLVVIFFSSCLTYRSIEYAIDFTDNFNQGTVTVKLIDLGSSETVEEKQKKDFNELLEIYQDDIFLLDAANEGIYIKERKLYEEGGKLVGSYSGIFQKLEIDDNELKVRDGERYVLVDISPSEDIESNGKVYRSENNALLVWPEDQKYLTFKKINRDDKKVGYSLLDYYKNWKN